MNAMEWNRDLRLPVADVRSREDGLCDKPDRGNGTVSFPAMREGRVGICVATQIARYAEPGSELSGWQSPEQAWAQTQGQLAWYAAMEEAGELVRIETGEALDRHLRLWESDDLGGEKLPIGYVLSLEGADSIISLDHLERAYEYGLRALGPAHYGPGVYANGTDSTGRIPARGKELLREMERLGMILDVTHLNDECFREALDQYRGAIWASHNNARAFVDHNRQMSDEMIRELVARDAVIGVALDAWMMVPNWERGSSDPREMNVNLEIMINNIDHICNLAGDSLHAGIGSDLDGGFGLEQTACDLDTIADLQKVPGLLRARGYTEEAVSNILHGNFVRYLETALS